MNNPEILKLQFILKEKFNKNVALSGIFDEKTQNAIKELKNTTTINSEQLFDIFEKEYEIIEEYNKHQYKTEIKKDSFLKNKFLEYFYPKKYIVIEKTKIEKIEELKKQLKKTGCHFFIDKEENIYEIFSPYSYIPFTTQEKTNLKQIEKISIFILINNNISENSEKTNNLIKELETIFNIEDLIINQ